jgi:transposase
LLEVDGMEIAVTDEQWKRVADKMSRQGVMGRPRADDRRCLNAILYVLITGCRWNDLPKEYGHDSTAWRRLNRWARDGTLLRLWRHLLRDLDVGGQIDWKRCAVDGSYVKAKKGATKLAARGPAKPRKDTSSSKETGCP